MAEALNLVAAILPLNITAGRDKSFTVTAEAFNTEGYTFLAQFRRTPDLNSNVLFELSSSGSSAQITNTPGANSVLGFQILAEDSEPFPGQTIYWSCKATSPAGLTDDWMEGPVYCEPTPTA